MHTDLYIVKQIYCFFSRCLCKSCCKAEKRRRDMWH